MGIVFSGMFGLGLVLFIKVQTDLHLNHILFGNMLAGSRRYRRNRQSSRRTRLVMSSNAGTSSSTASTRRKPELSDCRSGLLHYGLLAILSLTIVGAFEGRRHYPRHCDADFPREPSPS